GHPLAIPSGSTSRPRRPTSPPPSSGARSAATRSSTPTSPTARRSDEGVTMKADALTPRQLFDGKMHYEIPSFQRPYVWNEEDQWAPLWEDILRVAVSYLPSESGAAVDPERHFLGAIVYESRPPVVGDVTRHLVIDG